MSNVQKVRRRSAAEIEKAATLILKRFQAETLIQLTSFDVENFFEFELEDDTGIVPIYKQLGTGLDGYTDSANMKCYISESLYNHKGNLTKERRLRSTMAHEIGHCYLHVPDAKRNSKYQQLFKNDKEHPLERYQPEDIKVYENPEWQAWRFASALLMPEQCFRRAVECKWSKRQIQNTFEVNLSYVDLRIRELRIPDIIRRG